MSPIYQIFRLPFCPCTTVTFPQLDVNAPRLPTVLHHPRVRHREWTLKRASVVRRIFAQPTTTMTNSAASTVINLEDSHSTSAPFPPPALRAAWTVQFTRSGSRKWRMWIRGELKISPKDWYANCLFHFE